MAKRNISIRLNEEILKELEKRAEKMAKQIGIGNRNKVIEEILREKLFGEKGFTPLHLLGLELIILLYVILYYLIF